MDKASVQKNEIPLDRIAERHVFERRIKIRTKLRDKNIVADAWTRDMSESGLAAFVAEGFLIGEIVTLEISLSDSANTLIPATVARCLGTQYGFQFTALSAEQRSKILSALRGHPSIPYPGK